MKITPIVIQRFKEWLQETIERSGVDPALLGLTHMTDENIKRFIEEYCSGLNYEECKSHILDVFPILKKEINFEPDVLAQIQQDLQQMYGTPYISQAFKQFTSKYSYNEIQGMLADIKDTELDIFRQWCVAKYDAVDIDVRMIREVSIYGSAFQQVKYGSIELFFKQILDYYKMKPTTKLYILAGHGEDLLYAHKNPQALVLIAILDYDENIVLPVTQSDRNQYMAVFNKANKRGALIY